MTTIEYVYSAHSAFAYLGSNELARICSTYGVTIVHKPILLSPVVEAQGSLSFAERTQAHVDYFFGREIERWAEYRGVPVISHRPTHHDADYHIASGMVLALGHTGDAVDRMAHSLLEAHWRDDIDLSDLCALKLIATKLGHDANVLLEKAESAPVQKKLEQNSNWARQKNTFWVPNLYRRR